ncbi:MAG: hypothetical protein AAB781_00075 [Patescibacteria group bacterium]
MSKKNEVDAAIDSISVNLGEDNPFVIELRKLELHNWDCLGWLGPKEVVEKVLDEIMRQQEEDDINYLSSLGAE